MDDDIVQPSLKDETSLTGYQAKALCWLAWWNNWRASFPRLRYDQLMSFTWTGMLPLVLGFIILVPCILMAFEIA